MPDPRPETLDREALRIAEKVLERHPASRAYHERMYGPQVGEPDEVILSRALLAAEQRVEEAERDLRYELWMNHGHDGLYGDDGEMQCGRCPLDFKRAPMADVRAAARAGRLERAANAYAALAPHKAAEEETDA